MALCITRLTEHLSNHLLRHEERATQMHRQHLVKGRHILLQGGGSLVGNASVVHQRVDTAMVRRHIGHTHRHGQSVSYIAGPARMLRTQRLCTFGGKRTVQVEQRHRPPPLRQLLGRSPANALGSACDDDHWCRHALALSAMWLAVTYPKVMFGPWVMPAPG